MGHKKQANRHEREFILKIELENRQVEKIKSCDMYEKGHNMEEGENNKK